MNIDVKEEVRRAIQSEWPAFVAAHPNLSHVLDETLISESAARAIADDPEYQQAMQTAATIGAGAEAVVSIVTRLASQWLRRLV